MNDRGQERAKGTMLNKMMSLVLCSLFLMHFGAVGAGEDEGQSTQDGTISLISYDISGRAEGGFVEIHDARELYNQGGRTAVSYLVSLDADTNLTELEISAGEDQYSYQESQRELTDEEVVNGGDIVSMRYLDVQEAGIMINGMVDELNDPALFALSGNRLLVCQFPLNAFSFLTISVRSIFPIAEEGGLNTIEIPLANSVVIAGNDGGDGSNEDGSGGNDGGGLDKGSSPIGTVAMDISSIDTLEGLYSPTHDIAVVKNGYHEASFSWSGQADIGDSMTVYFNELDQAFGGGFLNYRMNRRTMFQENEDGYFMFLFNPNSEELEEQAMAKDIVIVIDTSGSMSGDKIAQAKSALRSVLDILSVEDRFTIVRFSGDVSNFRDELIKADEGNINSAHEWVQSLSAGGGTNINQALLDGLDILGGQQVAGRPREIIFLTDGLASSGVTNDADILNNVREKNVVREVGATLHVFGIGYDVNTILLDSLSEETGGNTMYIEPEQDIEEVLTPFYRTIASPVLTDISLEIIGIQPMARYPENIPDLYRGGKLNIVGIYHLDDTVPLPEKIRVYVNGTTASGNTSYVFSFSMEEPGKHDFLPRIYATRVVGDLLQNIKMNGETEETVALVEKYGKRYGIETPYTSLTIHTNSEFDSEGFRTLKGKASVQASNLISSYSSTTIAGKGLVQNARQVGDRVFIELDGVYVQSELIPDSERIEVDNGSLEEWVNENIDIDRFVKFGSTNYFSLASDKEVMDILALGPEIVFSTDSGAVAVTRGNLLLYIKNLKSVTWDQNLSVSWETNVPASAVLHYREAGENGTGDWKILRKSELTKDHNITIAVPYETYEFYIGSTDKDGNTAVKDNKGEYYTSHHFPLAIVAVRANIGYAIMAGQEVIIRWYTNVPANGALYVRYNGGLWELVDATSKTQEHEGRFQATSLWDGQVATYEFYVTAELGTYQVVEDNEGNYFSFDCVSHSNTSPSFSTGPGTMLLSIFILALLSTVFRSKTVKKRGEKNVGDRKASDDNVGDGKMGSGNIAPIVKEGELNATDPQETKQRMIGTFAGEEKKQRMIGTLAGLENVSFGKQGNDDSGK